jgi:DNA-directed RNA polymerase subunit alpha
MKININSVGEITANEIICPTGFSIINKNLHILTVQKITNKVSIEIYATRGRGFKTFNSNKDLFDSLSIIATDSNFSPIIRVSYEVDETKTTNTRNTETLTFDITTNGSIKPLNSLSIAAKILNDHFVPIINVDENINNVQIFNDNNNAATINNNLSQPKNNLFTAIDDLNLSVRSYNCLKKSAILTVQDLLGNTRNDLEHIKNLGKKSFREILNKLRSLNLKLRGEE